MGNTNPFPVERTTVKAFHSYLSLGLKAPHNMGWKDITNAELLYIFSKIWF